MFPLFSTNEESQVWQTLLRFDMALAEKEPVILDNLLTKDFYGTLFTGICFGKTDFIHHHCNTFLGLIKVTGQDIKNTTIRIMGNTAIVNRSITGHFRMPAANITPCTLQKSEVLVRLKGEWLLISSQETKVLSTNYATNRF